MNPCPPEVHTLESRPHDRSDTPASKMGTGLPIAHSGTSRKVTRAAHRWGTGPQCAASQRLASRHLHLLRELSGSRGLWKRRPDSSIFSGRSSPDPFTSASSQALCPEIPTESKQTSQENSSASSKPLSGRLLPRVAAESSQLPRALQGGSHRSSDRVLPGRSRAEVQNALPAQAGSQPRPALRPPSALALSSRS